MILNVSRTLAYESCPRRAFNTYHRRLATSSSEALAIGTAFHAAVAVGLASGDWDKAVEHARANTAQEIEKTTLPQEHYRVQEYVDMTCKMVDQYRNAFKDKRIQVLQPECEFQVAIPNSGHNCIMLHHLNSRLGKEVWGPPEPEDILNGEVHSPHRNRDGDDTCACWQPHTLRGKTDAIIKWDGFIWLMEHKTASKTGNVYWAQWHLAKQPTAYIYGIWKTLGIMPRGMVLNAVIKPTDNMVDSYNSRRKYGPNKTAADYLGYERDIFPRTEEDLKRFESEFIHTCNEWEERILKGYFPHYSHSCTDWNRVCEYHMLCVKHDDPYELSQFERRNPDYVDVSTAKLLESLNVRSNAAEQSETQL